MDKSSYWQLPIPEVFNRLGSSSTGLTAHEALARLKQYGFNAPRRAGRARGLILFFSQFKSALILLLIGAAILSFLLGSHVDALIILTIVFLSGLLGFFQERGALSNLEKLLQMVETKACVMRDGKEMEISMKEVVPGDLLILRAGDLVPADCMLVEALHCFVDEAIMTGESAPVEKGKSGEALLMGTTVASGHVKVIVIATGQQTEYSSIAEKVRFRPPETAFELGVHRFGGMLFRLTMYLVLLIFACNAFLHKPLVESLLFALALAVGLTPQLLPAIISVNLSHGARRMAKKRVVVKRLPSIENFGQMDVLCADKTGTLTIGKTKLEKATSFDGIVSERIALFAFLNAHFQSGYSNPLDRAILESRQFDIKKWKKVEEIPYDFVRKRISVVLENDQEQILIAKGAVPQLLAICTRLQMAEGQVVSLAEHKAEVEAYFEEQSRLGFRLLAVATATGIEEKELTFLGFLQFFDPLKPGIAEVIDNLRKRGIHLKVITGDNRFAAAHVASLIGLNHGSLVTGSKLSHTSDTALLKLVNKMNVFAEVEPNQKERIILALRHSGHVVGFMGDGVNDVAALHSADVGIAVESGADVAKEAADIVLLEKDLSVLQEGIEEGRRTFGNTMKYVYMASSANLGNMFSMAGVSLFLKFLPMLPTQILMTNFLSDLPEMTLASDRIDKELVRRPVKWDLKLIRRFMIVFGLLNSFSDFLTFGVLLYWLKADQKLFQTGWFIENIVSAALIVLVIRTRKPFFRSRPSGLLFWTVLAVTVGILALPYTAVGAFFGLIPLPLFFYLCLGGIIAIYVVAVEIAKHFFFRKVR